MQFGITGISIAALCVAFALPANAEWQPGGIVPSTAVLADVLAASARVSTSPDPRFAQRREHWTYVTGAHTIGVNVTVRDADFRTSLDIAGLTYMAGRRGGVHWRGDGNGIVHGIEADLQGDALDRPPQAVFPLDPTTLALVGETRLPAPAWVIATKPDGDKPVFLYVDKANATIVREVLRDGRRVVTTTFDRFAPVNGALRARHWRIDDGTPADAVDVTVDTIEPAVVASTDIAFPTQRTFAPATPLPASVTLDSTFHGNEVALRVDVNGTRHSFVLDTGTTSITVDPVVAEPYGGSLLEHAVLPHVTVGPLTLDHVSVLTVPFGGDGILGYDFFFGHVVEINYLQRRVRVLSNADAQAVFADPTTDSIAANIDQGLPLVPAALGSARSDAFALDTGSPHLYVMRPFMSAFASEIAKHWAPAGRTILERYLEGGIELQPYRVASFQIGSNQARNLIVGGQVPTTRTDDLAIPFDGIIGTDILQNFDLYIDYDHDRIGLRR